MNHDDSPDFVPWEFEVKVPEGDDVYVTHHLAESAVNKLAATLRELVTAVEVHEEMAPKTALPGCNCVPRSRMTFWCGFAGGRSESLPGNQQGSR